MKKFGEKITAWKGPSDQKALLTNKPINMKFAPRTLTHSGVPESSDALAYEPVQRLLAVSTGDGRVKVFGQYGVECLMTSARTEGTSILCFLPNSGSIIRVTHSGVLELFDLDVHKVTSTIELNADAITSIALIPGQPYIMLGCLSGVLRVCCMADGNLDPITQARPIVNLRLLNYRVSKHALGVGGRMTHLSICLSQCGPLALMIHSTSGLLIWNIRFSRPVCQLPNMSLDVLVSANITDPGEVTCAAWVGKLTSPYLFATGHDSGDVFTWCLPDELRGVSDTKQVRIPRIMHQFVIRPEHSVGSKVQSISFISGDEDCLLVFGGQPLEEPSGLNLFQLALEQTPEELSEHVPLTGKPTGLAWFGTILDFALVPPKGSMEHFDDPVGIIVLTEAGNLVMHDLESGAPTPFSMPFQMIQKHCSASFFMKLPPSSALVKFLTSNPRKSEQEMEEIGGLFDKELMWMLSGGTLEPEARIYGTDKSLLVLGYEDGTIRFWRLRNGIPLCLYSIQKNDLFNTAAIKTIEFLDEGSFLIVGDEKGKVFLFQLSDVTRRTKLRKFTNRVGTPDIEETLHEPGYQLLIVFSLNTGCIVKLAFHLESQLLAALDNTGGTCVVNLVTLDLFFLPFSAVRGENAIVDIAFLETASVSRDQEGSAAVYLFMTDQASNLIAINPATGAIAKDADWVHPRNASKSIRLLSCHDLCPLAATSTLAGAEAFFWTAGDVVEEMQRYVPSEEPASAVCEKTDDADKEEMEDVEKSERISSTETGSSPVAPPTEEETSSLEGITEIHHARDVSDDAETGAMLAAAVANMEPATSMPDPKPQTKSRKVLVPWKKKPQEESPEISIRVPDPTDGVPGVSSPCTVSGTYLVLVTESFIRLYAPHSIVSSIRTPLHKISFPGQIAWALPVFYNALEEMDRGLLVLTYEGSITLIALPNLEIIGVSRLDDIVQFPLFGGNHDEEGSLSRLKLFEGDGAGGTYACSLNGELIHFDCLQRSEVPSSSVNSKPPFTLFDWELAHAAHSASQLTQAEALHANIPVVGEQPTPTATFKRGMDFFVTWGRKARDELDKALRTTGGRNEGTSSPSTQGIAYEPPELSVLFCANDHKTPPEIRSSPQGQTSFQEPVKVTGPPRRPDDNPEIWSPKTPVQRTADEVRAKYGRPRTSYRNTSTADQVGNIMNENLSELHQRGERLRALNDKTEDMVNDAQSFASLAKQLAAQKSKKWWQF